MEEVIIILASGLVACMILGTIGGTVVLIVRTAKGGRSRKSGKSEAEETQLIQEIHRGMMKMGKRVEALETLMLDEDRSKRAKFDRELSED